MPNTYYNNIDEPIPLTRTRAGNEAADRGRIELAFDKLPTEDELKSGAVNYAADTGVANAYVVTTPYTTAYFEGLNILFAAGNSNTGASTINVNGLGAKSLVQPDGAALEPNDIVAGGTLSIVYDGSVFKTVIGSTSAARVAADEAAVSAAAALVSENNAATSETNAANSEAAALVSENNASTSETNAAASAAAALVSEGNASTSEGNASTSAAAALVSEGNAATSETNAAASAASVLASEINASNSAAAALVSENNAAGSEAGVAASAAAALVSEGNAATSETNAGNSAAAASISETNAGDSETNASNSAAAALVSEGNASTSETNASNSAAAALVSEGNASTSETNASNSAAAALVSELAAAVSAGSLTYASTPEALALTVLDRIISPGTLSDVLADIQQDVLISSTTGSSSTITGALVVSGGAGFAKKINGVNMALSTTLSVDGLITFGAGGTITKNTGGTNLILAVDTNNTNVLIMNYTGASPDLGKMRFLQGDGRMRLGSLNDAGSIGGTILDMNWDSGQNATNITAHGSWDFSGNLALSTTGASLSVGTTGEVVNSNDGAQFWGTKGSLMAFGNDVVYGYNFYYNSGWKRRGVDVVSHLSTSALFPLAVRYAASGSAGSAITWTDALLVYASGNARVLGTVEANQDVNFLNGISIKNAGVAVITGSGTNDLTFANNGFFGRRVEAWSFRAVSTGTAATGDGLELLYNGTGIIQAYDRDTAQYKNLEISGGTGTVQFNQTVATIFRGSNGVGLNIRTIASTPNETACVIGDGTGGFSGTNGDLCMAPRTNAGGAIVMYTGAAGGIERLRILPSGIVQISNGSLTIPGGAAAVQISTAANGSYAMNISNSGVNAFFGIDTSGGSRFVGSNGNAVYIGQTTAGPIDFGTSNTVRMTIGTTGTIIIQEEILLFRPGTGITLLAGEGECYSSPSNGMIVRGYGSAFDVCLMNRGGSIALLVEPNTTNVRVTGNFEMGSFSGTGASHGVEYASNVLSVSTTGTALVNMMSFNNANSQVGTIRTTGTATQYNQSSDPDLKTAFTEITTALDRIRAAHDAGAIGETSFLVDPDHKQWMYNAQWLGENQPDTGGCVRGELGAAMMDYGRRTPTIEAGLYELLIKLESLEKTVEETIH